MVDLATNVTEKNIRINVSAGWGSNPVIASSWNDLVVGPQNGVNTTSNFKLKEGSPGKNAGTDGKDIGIYGGTGFSDTALPPMPRITTKNIADQTDENGMLKIQIQVKAQ